ncbi:MAG: sulfotransferase [Planctomycetota bacterium]
MPDLLHDKSVPLIVAVAGMHRSGTSMFAGFVHRAGISMGERLHVDRVTNPYGHYEDLDFLDLQRAEIARAFDGEDFLVAEEFTPSQAFLDDARRLVERNQRLHEGRPWGWKDPRTTLFLRQWKELLPELRVVALVRSPHSVLNSLCRRLRAYFSVKQKNHLLRTYTHYNRCLDAFRDLHPESTHLLSLEQLLANPEEKLALLGEALGHPLDPEAFRSMFDSRVMERSRRASVLLHRASIREARAIHEKLLGRCL